MPISGTALTTLHSFDGGSNQGHPWGRVIPIGDYLYGMTVNGGANVIGTIYRIPAAGGALVNLHEFAGERPTAVGPSGSLPCRRTGIPSTE